MGGAMSIGAVFVEEPADTVKPPVALPDDGVERELIRGELREYGMAIRDR
jgi:hypothetical protein